LGSGDPTVLEEIDMQDQDEKFNLFREYMGFKQKTMLWYMALVAGVVVLVTVIYTSIFGYGTWKRNMQRAGSMMVANFDPAAPGVNLGPVAPAPYGVVPAAAPAQQYVCPGCGATGLPNWSPGGAPQCPNCGTIMAVAGRRSRGIARQAAAP
jgi:predicted RNA-binding Zn-ribbon protein involved in translation (DUF1610 family)